MNSPIMPPSPDAPRRLPINPLYEGMRGFSLTLGDGHRMDLLITRGLTPAEYDTLHRAVELMRFAIVAEEPEG